MKKLVQSPSYTLFFIDIHSIPEAIFFSLDQYKAGLRKDV